MWSNEKDNIVFPLCSQPADFGRQVFWLGLRMLQQHIKLSLFFSYGWKSKSIDGLGGHQAQDSEENWIFGSLMCIFG
jgi:hypothetical protein